MGSITIEGGHRLGGDVTVQGAKNSVLPILAARCCAAANAASGGVRI